MPYALEVIAAENLTAWC